MEPTQTRSGGSNKPSAAKRYGPLAVIVAIVAVSSDRPPLIFSAR